MARTLLPTPEDPDRGHGHPAAGSAPDEQALAGYGLGGHAQPAGDGPTSGHERLRYLPMLTCCYAVVLYDASSAQLVRRIIGMFADPDEADAYARDGGHRLYDVVPATAVTPTPPPDPT